MRFVDFLTTGASWLAKYRDQQLDAKGVVNLISRLQSQEIAHLCAEQVHIFCVYSPLQAIQAYFLVSFFGLTAAVVSPRNLRKMLDDLNPDCIGKLIVPSGHRLPDKHGCKDILSIDLADADNEEAIKLGPANNRCAKFVFCTSGTTGKAKRVVHSETSLIANAEVVANYLSLSEQDRTFCVFPMQYMYGLSTTLCTLWSNSQIHFGDFVRPSLIAGYVAANHITVLPILGEWSSELDQTWRAKAFSPERLVILNASDRLLLQHAQELLPWASHFWNNLGQTESGPRIFAIELVNQPSLQSISYNNTVAVGEVVHKDIEVRLVNIENDVGTLQYKTPFMMLGYLKNSGEIEPSQGWIDSGDLFRLDDNGCWHWVSRNSHTIKINGELVPLTSVTNHLLEHSEISGVGYVTNKKGELCAFVESSSQCNHLKQKLVLMMMDTLRGKRLHLTLIDQLPRNENGKLDLSLLRRQNTDQVITDAGLAS